MPKFHGSFADVLNGNDDGKDRELRTVTDDELEQLLEPADVIRIRRRYKICVVAKPAGWQPQEWNDVPPSAADTLWTERQGVNKRSADGFLFGFNNASLAADGRLWAIIRPDHGRTAGSAPTMHRRKVFA